MPREEIEAIEHGWTALLADVRANRDLDERGAFEGNMRAPQAADFAFFERVKAARANSPEVSPE
jgi:hypothetical protein